VAETKASPYVRRRWTLSPVAPPFLLMANKHSIPTKTTVFLLVLVAASLGWEFWALSDASAAWPITDEIANLGAQFLSIPLGFGVLVGHFFWPRKPTPAEFRRWYGEEPPQ